MNEIKTMFCKTCTWQPIWLKNSWLKDMNRGPCLSAFLARTSEIMPDDSSEEHDSEGETIPHVKTRQTGRKKDVSKRSIEPAEVDDEYEGGQGPIQRRPKKKQKTKKHGSKKATPA